MSAPTTTGRDALRGVGSKDHKKLLAELIGRGFHVERRKSGHLRVTSPDGEPFTTPLTPRNTRATKALRAWSRRRGEQR